MRVWTWNAAGGFDRRLDDLLQWASKPGLLRVQCEDRSRVGSPVWTKIEPWTRSRAVTFAEIRADLGSPELEVALCCDVVIARRGALLKLVDRGCLPSPAVVWAAGRAGPRALRAILLSGRASMAVEEGRELGLIHRLLGPEEPFPKTAGVSISALTAARDLVRSAVRGAGGMELEAATFRFLFGVGDPREGADAFLEKRAPRYD